MRKILAYLIFFLTIFIVGFAYGSVVRELNVATVPVANASTSVRAAALSDAFRQVLVKLSGNSSVMTVPTIQNALDDVGSYIQSYGYINRQLSDETTQLLLQVTFDQKALKQLLRQAGQADWSSNRPLTLLWVRVVNLGEGDTDMLSNTISAAPLVQAVQAAAKRRGIPILLPSMDLQDQSFLNENKKVNTSTSADTDVDTDANTDTNADVTDTFNQTVLEQASDRYGAGAVLAGDIQAIQPDGNQWQGSWLLLINDTPYQWRDKADSSETLLKRAMNQVADLMAGRLAVANTKALQTNVTLNISNVQTLNDYAKVLQTVRHLSPVANVSIKDMEGSNLLLSVKIVGGEQALANALVSDSHFIGLDNTAEHLDTKADLFYRWQAAVVAGGDGDRG